MPILLELLEKVIRMAFKTVAAATLLGFAAMMPAATHAQEFTNTEPSCAVYGNWIVDLMRKADRAGCDMANVRDWFDPQRHVKWCMGQSAARMTNAVEISRGDIAGRCARKGIDARKIR